MKQLNSKELTSIVGAGFWSDVGDKIRDSFSSSSNSHRNDKRGSFTAYEKNNVSIDIGGSGLGGGKGIGVGARVTIKY